MKNLLKLFAIGLIAGVLDLIPLIFANAPIFNMISVLVFWLVAVYFIYETNIDKRNYLNGLFVSVLLMLPLALAVSATNPRDFIPMMLMAILLGPLCGFLIGKFIKATPVDRQ